MIIYRFNIICTVRHTLRAVSIKALLLHMHFAEPLLLNTCLYVTLQHMDNQNGQHRATSLCTQTDDPINKRQMHSPSMFLL